MRWVNAQGGTCASILAFDRRDFVTYVGSMRSRVTWLEGVRKPAGSHVELKLCIAHHLPEQPREFAVAKNPPASQPSAAGNPESPDEGCVTFPYLSTVSGNKIFSVCHDLYQFFRAKYVYEPNWPIQLSGAKSKSVIPCEARISRTAGLGRQCISMVTAVSRR